MDIGNVCLIYFANAKSVNVGYAAEMSNVNSWNNKELFLTHVSCPLKVTLGVLLHVINILEPGLLGQPLSGTLPISVQKEK